jgi:hypothetical protein
MVKSITSFVEDFLSISYITDVRNNLERRYILVKIIPIFLIPPPWLGSVGKLFLLVSTFLSFGF